MDSKPWLKYLKHFIVVTLISFLLIGVSLPFAFMGHPKYKYTDSDWDDLSYIPEYNHTEWNILLDAHSHTLASDGYLTARQNLLWHISLGYNAMVLTDHNTFDNVEEIRQIAREEYNNTIKVLVGVEWTTDRIHMNIVLPPNVTQAQYETLLTFKSYTYTPTDLEIQTFIQSTHNLGGVVTVNHIPWSMDYTTNHPTRQQLYGWGIDYIEVVNENTYDNESYYFCLDNGLGMITGTDMHAPGEVYSWTTLNATEFTEEAIFAEIKFRRTGFIFTGIPSPYPIEHQINPSYIALYPLIKIGDLFENMYASGMLGALMATLFGYIYGIFVVVELLLFGLNKLSVLIKKKKLEKNTKE